MSYKSSLLEYCQKRKIGIPVYTVRRDGPDHLPRFTATVRVGTGEDSSEYTGLTSNTMIKKAEHDAAKVALEKMNAAAAGVDGAGVEPAGVGRGAAVVAIKPASKKCALQEICQLLKEEMPRYEWLHSGPPHDRKFKGSVIVFGRRLSGGSWTTSIKSAEEQAAGTAIEFFRDNRCRNNRCVRGSSV